MTKSFKLADIFWHLTKLYIPLCPYKIPAIFCLHTCHWVLWLVWQQLHSSWYHPVFWPFSFSVFLPPEMFQFTGSYENEDSAEFWEGKFATVSLPWVLAGLDIDIDAGLHLFGKTNKHFTCSSLFSWLYFLVDA